MYRVFRSPLLMMAAAAAAACHDERQPLSTEPPALSHTLTPPTAADIRAEIDALFPAGKLRSDAQREFDRIVRYVSRGETQEARDQTRDLIDFTIRQFEAGRLLDPNGSSPPTTRQAVAHLICSLEEYVELPCPFVPGASLEDVGFRVVGPRGGDVLAPSRLAGIRIPKGALAQAVLVVVQKLPDPATPGAGPLPTELDQYPFFYEISTTPLVVFTKNVTIGICQAHPGANPFAPPSQDVLDRLRLAHPDPADRTTVELLPRVAAPFVDCERAPHEILTANVGLSREGLLAGWGFLRHYGTWVFERLIGPRPLYAVNSPVGGKTESLSPFGAVDPVFFSDDFEAASAWTSTGFWNRSTLAGIANAAFPTYVNVASDDRSNGSLPAPFAGSYAFWYGQPATGNFIGVQRLGDLELSGGTSIEGNSGTLTSPPFTIPMSANPASFRFGRWFEIEGVNPSGSDLMTVAIRDVGTGSVTSLARMNPQQDPDSPSPPILRASLPFTSAGFNLAPTWGQVVLDLSAWRGKRVQVTFDFNTVNLTYNGFRGWIIDNVSARLDDRP